MTAGMQHVVMFSGGLGSWAAAKRVAERHGTKDMTLLFTDTLAEDPDLYRFLHEAAADIGAPLAILRDGRTPWQVYKDERFLGNSSRDPCSKILKRQPAARWLEMFYVPSDTIVYVGIDWTEIHRFDDGNGRGIRPRRAAEGWTYAAPLCEPPYLTKTQMQAALAAAGIALPRLYGLGFAHNNCGGVCCKAGQGQFALLLEKLPEVYARAEAEEEAIRQFLGKDVSMMSDRTGDGKKKTLTMRRFRERVEAKKEPIDHDDIGGCGCFVDDDNSIGP